MSVYVVRTNKTGLINDSAPCYDCHHKMKELGIKNIIYSVEGGGFKKVRCRDYEAKSMSFGKMYILGGYKPLKRDKVHDQKYGLAQIHHTHKMKAMKPRKNSVASTISTITDTNTITDTDTDTLSTCSSISYQSLRTYMSD